MKRFLQRDTVDEFSRYLVYDEKGELRGRINGKITPSGEFVRILDNEGNILCKIRRFGLNVLSAYGIRANGETVRMNISLNGSRASVRFRGISFFVRGDVLSGSYDIIDADSSVICAVYKDFSKGCIDISIALEEREMFCIAAAVCIDSIRAYTAPALQAT